MVATYFYVEGFRCSAGGGSGVRNGAEQQGGLDSDAQVFSLTPDPPPAEHLKPYKLIHAKI